MTSVALTANYRALAPLDSPRRGAQTFGTRSLRSTPPEPGQRRVTYRLHGSRRYGSLDTRKPQRRQPQGLSPDLRQVKITEDQLAHTHTT